MNQYNHVNSAYHTITSIETEIEILLQVGDFLLKKGLITDTECEEYKKLVRASV